MKNFLQYLNYALISGGIFFAGVFFGLIYQINEASFSFSPVQIISEPKSCVIELAEVSPFGIKGDVAGNDLRIKAQNNILEIPENHNFQINTAALFRNIKAVIPKNTSFFASKRGKKFYDITNTKKLEKISPENIVFFKNEKAALAAGFLK